MDSCSSEHVGWAEPGDPLAEVLAELRLTQCFHCHGELRAPWALRIPRRDYASFHFVAEGGAWLRGASPQPIRLEHADFALIADGSEHSLGDTPRGEAPPIDALPLAKVSENVFILRHGGTGVRTVLISGGVRFEDSAVNPLLDLMPPLLHIRGKMSSGDPLFGQMLAAMGPESLAPRPGGANVMTRLSNVLVTNAVRSWLEHGWDGRGGFLGAVTDPGIGRALALMHRRPEETWTVTSLAERIKMSRSTFSEKFTTLVGLPPMQYLTRWRMHLATRWLEGAVVEPNEVASRLGYESEPSFRRAFKKHAGVTPRAARKTPPEL